MKLLLDQSLTHKTPDTLNDEGVVVVTDGAQKSEKPKESSGWKIGNVGAVIGAGIIGLLSVMIVRYLTLVLQMLTRA
ncbi:hypothetical protein FRC0119_02170 [Corynebacterium diphtheriae]|nr:hypothetical protein FRC0119_02170 [Corynebacterium diphtheriae]